ncbi:hypothetical protein BDL97_17G060800 [Sphagnum fallax]|nr:hypothetical protein BDL97_17G060800 [Sphagnum fallax]KAH8936005.1 hypothetical protein BDL97_17G060800 [Sphagnum fallax]
MAMAGMCSSCHSLEMGRGDDGFWYCRVCGAQSQNFLEEAFDHDDVHLFNLRHVREKNVARGEDMMMAGILASQQQQQDQQQQELGLFSSQNFSQQNLAFLGDFSSQFGVLSQFGSQPGIAKIEQTGPVLPESLVAHTLNSQVGLSQADKLSSKIRSVYVEGMQILLQLQCEALVQKFGVNPLVCGIAGPVWMRFVASTCVFEKGWANEVLLVAEARALKPRKSRQSGISERTEDKEFKRKRKLKKRHLVEPWTTYGESARHVWLKNLKGRIPLRATLAILFLVCHIARESILPTDLTKWALDGSLPYIAAHTEISKRLEWPAQQPLPLTSKLMFKPQNITSARVIEYLASLIADRIKIELPPVNFHAIASRFLKELDLPVQKLGFYVCRLFEWYPISGLWLSSQESCFPTRVYVMAMLVVTFKIVYKLDGRDSEKTKSTLQRFKGLKGTVASSSNEGSNMRDLQENDCAWDSKEFVAKLENQVCDDHECTDDQEELMAYLKYCRDVIFAGERLTTDEEQLRDYFWELYKKASEKDASVKCSRATNLKLGRTDSEQEGSKALGEEFPSTCTNTSPQSQASLHQNLNDTSFGLGSHLEPSSKSQWRRILLWMMMQFDYCDTLQQGSTPWEFVVQMVMLL